MALKIVIVNKSDSTGGAAIVSRRLTEALREAGADAVMLVAERLTDYPYVHKAASDFEIKSSFLRERLAIFTETGFNKRNIFKIDTGQAGLPLWKHPLIKEADAIILNWVNQGMLSLKGLKKLLGLNKPVLWTMHDMWCVTGICHHAGCCVHYQKECGNCPLLGKLSSEHDLSYSTWKKKKSIYDAFSQNLRFISVSSWLYEKSRLSSLTSGMQVSIIPNAFKVPATSEPRSPLAQDEKIRILFGAARIDDPIKGLDSLKRMTRIVAEKKPETARKLELVFFGALKNPDALSGLSLPHIHLGTVHGEEELKRVYADSHILLSASEYETLPGTLVEAQAYGCIPVSFDRGGQKDIVDHLKTGYIACRDENSDLAAENLAEGIIWATGLLSDPRAYTETVKKMRESVEEKFSYAAVAAKYMALIDEMKSK